MKGARGTRVGAAQTPWTPADFVPALLPWPPEALAAAGAFAGASCPFAAGSCAAVSFRSSCWSCSWTTADATGFGPNLVHAREKQHHIQCQEQEFQPRAFVARRLLHLRGGIFSHSNPPGQRTKGAQLAALSPLPSTIHCRLAFEVDGFRE